VSTPRFGRVRWACERGLGRIFCDESKFQSARLEVAGLAPFDKREDAGEMAYPPVDKKPLPKASRFLFAQGRNFGTLGVNSADGYAGRISI